jgi:hypothetical protein
MTQHEGAGKTEFSWIKHRAIDKFGSGQVASFRLAYPQAPMLLIDGNAGDGKGVEIPSDLFNTDRIKRKVSRSTPELLSDLASDHHTQLCLCEKNKDKRLILKDYFPEAYIFPRA